MMMNTAIRAAIEAGEAILDIYAQDFEVEFKADESPLTSADKAAHNLIVHALESTPYPVLSEESEGVTYEERKNWESYWLVDPLDGTKEFIKKNGEFTVNIALIENGVPVLGVVYVPVEQALYFGDQNGAFKAVQGKHFQSINDLLGKLSEVDAFQRLKVSGTPGQPLRVVASKSHCNEETLTFISELEKIYGKAELVSRGSSLKLCMIAEGSADIYPRIAPTMEWDTAAAHAVVVAAGGTVVIYGTTDALVYNKENLLNPSFVVSGI